MKTLPDSTLPTIALPKTEVDLELMDEFASSLKSAETKNEKLAILQNRAKEYMKAQQWNEAAEDYLFTRDFAPGESLHWIRAAIALKLAHKTAQYDQLVKEMLAKFGTTSNASDAERTAKIYWLPKFRANNQTVEEAVEALAELAVKNKHKTRGQYFLSSRALGHYRSQNYDSAITAIEESNRLNNAQSKPQSGLSAINELIRIMAMAKKGEFIKARKRLREIADILQTQFKDAETLYADDVWDDWLFARLLYEEARGEVGLEITVGQPINFYTVISDRTDTDPTKRTVTIAFRVYNRHTGELVRTYSGIVPRVVGETLPEDELDGVQALVTTLDNTGVIIGEVGGKSTKAELPAPQSYSESPLWRVETSEEDWGVARWEIVYRKHFSVIEVKSGKVLFKAKGYESREPLGDKIISASGVRAVHVASDGRHIALAIWNSDIVWLEFPMIEDFKKNPSK